MYSARDAAEICRRLAEGESLRTISKTKGMPGESTVRQWVMDHPDFAEQYGKARNIGLDAIIDDTIRIADDVTEDANSRRVRIDARRWYASKLRPDKYGDRVQVDATVTAVTPAQVLREARAKRLQAPE